MNFDQFHIKVYHMDATARKLISETARKMETKMETSVGTCLRPNEFADKYKISRAQAYKLIATGIVPSIRFGRSVRVPVDSLQAWLDKNTRGGNGS